MQTESTKQKSLMTERQTTQINGRNYIVVSKGPNRSERRNSKIPKIIVRPEPIELKTKSKLEKREFALAQLEKQLEQGTKPAKIKTIKGIYKLLPHDPNTGESKKVGESMSLSADDKFRIRQQIASLKNKIMFATNKKLSLLEK